MAQEFLERQGIAIEQVTDARQVKIGAAEAWERLGKARTVHLARGPKIQSWQPAAASREELLAGAMGRSGSLRAPALQIGPDFLIGFNEDMYRRFFSGDFV